MKNIEKGSANHCQHPNRNHTNPESPVNPGQNTIKMIIYNVTVKVDHEVHEDWIAWMKEVHIPDVMETGFFVENKFYKVLLQDESDGITYAIQYFCKNMSDLQKYQGNHAARLQKEHIDRYGEKCVAFRTLLETA